MKWPWMSRSTADMIERRRVGEAQHYEREIAALRADLSELRRMYHELRVAGASTPAPAIPVTLRAQKPADEAIEAVVSRFNGNAMLRKRLQKYVHAERMKQDYDESAELTIANKVLHWSDPDEDAA